MGFLEVLTIVFVVLKLTDVIAWSWLMVFSPMLIGYAVIFKRAVQIACSAHAAGKFFSLVAFGPHVDMTSKPFKALASSGQVFLLPADDRNLPMTWITNAPWIIKGLSSCDLQGCSKRHPGDLMQEMAEALNVWLSSCAREEPVAHAPSCDDPIADLASDLKSARRDRDEADDQCVGGLRNPNQAVARNPHLRMIGKRVRKVLNSVASNGEYAQEIDGAVD